MGEAILGAAILGTAASVGSGMYAQRKQAKAARSAAAAAEQASKASVVTQTNTAAAPVTQAAQASEAAVQRQAKKRLSMSDTVNTFTPAGLRNTLG